MKRGNWVLLVLAVFLVGVLSSADPRIFAQNSNSIITFQTDQQTFNNLVANSGNAIKINGFPIIGNPSSGATYPCFNSGTNSFGWCSGGSGGGVTFAQDLTGTSTAQQVVGIGHVTTGTLGIANGGTGATGASAARTALGAAQSGANGDITSLTAALSANALTSASSLPLNGLGAPTANYSLNNHTLTNATPASTPGMPLIYGQNTGSIGDLTSTNSGLGKGLFGQVNNIFNVKAFGAKGDGSTADEAAIQSAITTACANGTANNFPVVYFPNGNYHLTSHGIVNTCAGNNLEFKGDGLPVSQITAGGNFPVFQDVSGSVQTGLGAVTTTSLATGSGAAMNWANGSSPLGAYYYDLGTALYPASGFVPNELNGLTALAFRFYISTPIADSSLHTIAQSSNFDGDGVHAANRAFVLNYTNTTLTAGVNTGSSRGNGTTATGTLTASTTMFIEYDADCAGTGYMVVFYGTPGGTTSHGTPVACTGNILQDKNEEIDMGQASPGSRASGPNMEGAIDSFEMEKVAFHTCPSGTCTNFTAPTTKFTADGNTMLLLNGIDSTGTYTFGNNAMPVTFPTGNTQMPLMSDNGAQDKASYVRDLALSGGNVGYLSQLRPASRIQDILVENNFNSYAGVWLYDNSYNVTMDNVWAFAAGRYGYRETNASFAFNRRLKVAEADTLYSGGGACTDCEMDPGGASGTVIPIEIQTAQGLSQPMLYDLEYDPEGGYNGPAIFLDGGKTVLGIYGGNWTGSGSSESLILMPLTSSTDYFLGLHDLSFSSFGSGPIVSVGTPTGNLRITADNVYVGGSPVTEATMAGATYAADVFVNNGTPPDTIANLGTCNAASEGQERTQTNSTAACSAGTTATNAGTTHCQVYCNSSNWVQTGR